MSNQDKVDQAELEQHGIEPVPADVYLWRGYRYSSERYALAAEKRNSRR